MTGEWFTAAELEALGLPGLPGTRRGIALRAKAEGWLARPRHGRGGGREFHRSALPHRARRNLLVVEARAIADRAAAMDAAERERLRTLAQDLARLLLAIAEELR